MCAQTRPRFTLLSESVFLGGGGGGGGGMQSETMLIPRDKSPLLDSQRRFEPTTLHHTRKQAQHTTD